MAKQKSSLAAAFKGSFGRTEEAQDEQVRRTTESKLSQESVIKERREAVITVGEVEMVPGANGRKLPADQPVNMTFTVTAKERYLWNLELSRRGLTGVSVLRRAMNELQEQDDL
jgi:hypothetical protein